MTYGQVTENELMPHWSDIQREAYTNAYACAHGNPYTAGTRDSKEYSDMYNFARSEILEAIEAGEIGVCYK